MKLVDSNNLAIKALTLFDLGQQGITKHQILEKMQELEPLAKDGYVIGRAIFKLVEEGFLNQIGKKGNANLYERIK